MNCENLLIVFYMIWTSKIFVLSAPHHKWGDFGSFESAEKHYWKHMKHQEQFGMPYGMYNSPYPMGGYFNVPYQSTFMGSGFPYRGRRSILLFPMILEEPLKPIPPSRLVPRSIHVYRDLMTSESQEKPVSLIPEIVQDQTLPTVADKLNPHVPTSTSIPDTKVNDQSLENENKSAQNSGNLSSHVFPDSSKTEENSNAQSPKLTRYFETDSGFTIKSRSTRNKRSYLNAYLPYDSKTHFHEASSGSRLHPHVGPLL